MHTHTIQLNNSEFPAFNWTEVPLNAAESQPRHTRNQVLLVNGVNELGVGEVFFQCDQTFAFDSTFSLKGDGRKFVIIASESGRHVAKPY